MLRQKRREQRELFLTSNFRVISIMILAFFSLLFAGTALFLHHRRHDSTSLSTRRPYALNSILLPLPSTLNFDSLASFCYRAITTEIRCEQFTAAAIFDIFYSCDRMALYIIARPTIGETLDVLKIQARVIYNSNNNNDNNGTLETPLVWAKHEPYETVAVGVWRGFLPVCISTSSDSNAAVNVSFFSIQIEYGPSNRWTGVRPLSVVPHAIPLREWRENARRPSSPRHGVKITETPPLPLQQLPAPARTNIGLCTTVTRSSSSIRFFIEYYSALGVNAFFFYAASPPNTTHELSLSLSRTIQTVHTNAAVSVIPWPHHFFSPVSRDFNYAQSPALNSCASRFGGSVTSLIFVDIDEFIILRQAPTIQALILKARQRPYPAGPIDVLITRMAWAIVGETPSHIASLRGAFEPWRRLPRAPPNRTLTYENDIYRTCKAWTDGPIGDNSPHDDDDSSLWGENETIIESECFALARGGDGKGLISSLSSSPLPSPVPNDSGEPFWGILKRSLLPTFRLNYTTKPLRMPPPLLGEPLSQLSIESFIGNSPHLPISRSAVLSSGREKYILTDTKVLLPQDTTGPPLLVNIHGVYSLTDTAKEKRMDETEAYHIHLLNGDDAITTAPRITAFLLNFRMKSSPLHMTGPIVTNPGVFESQKNGLPIELQLDTQFTAGISEAIRERLKRKKEEEVVVVGGERGRNMKKEEEVVAGGGT
jgi:hypothetical protein